MQTFSGSVQQGFYGLSYQIGAICFLFTGAMTTLITREFSIAYAKQDPKQMAYLFRRYIPLFCGIAAFFSCFIAVQAENVAYILGGAKFHDAVCAIAIMAFYPIFQTYGQLSGSVFYATGKTGLYSKLGIIFKIIGLPVTYFLIAPVDMMGLNAGSTGLAIKMVLIQFVAVNVLLYFSARLLQLPFVKYLGQQFLCLGSLITAAWIARLSVNTVTGIEGKIIINFVLSGMLYTAIVIGFLYLQPLIFGFKKEDKNVLLKVLLNKLRSNR